MFTVYGTATVLDWVQPVHLVVRHSFQREFHMAFSVCDGCKESDNESVNIGVESDVPLTALSAGATQRKVSGEGLSNWTKSEYSFALETTAVRQGYCGLVSGTNFLRGSSSVDSSSTISIDPNTKSFVGAKIIYSVGDLPFAKDGCGNQWASSFEEEITDRTDLSNAQLFTVDGAPKANPQVLSDWIPTDAAVPGIPNVFAHSRTTRSFSGPAICGDTDCGTSTFSYIEDAYLTGDPSELLQ